MASLSFRFGFRPRLAASIMPAVTGDVLQPGPMSRYFRTPCYVPAYLVDQTVGSQIRSPDYVALSSKGPRLAAPEGTADDP